jgi:hypothetical protein
MAKNVRIYKNGLVLILEDFEEVLVLVKYEEMPE